VNERVRNRSGDTLEQPVGRQGRLVVLAGPLFGRAFAVDGDETTIGRCPEATIVLDDHPGVSRRHAVIVQVGGQFAVEDLGSRNGTFVNGQQVTQRTPLRFGDRLQLGADCVLLFTYSDPAAEFLDHLRRMETVGRMTAGIAHDFNNLLMVLVTSLEHLRKLPLDDVLPGMDAGAAAEDGLAAALQGVELTKKILSLSRPADDVMALVDVEGLVRDAAHLSRRLMGDLVRLRVQVEPELTIWGSRGDLQQVLINLCINARDAMPRGGVLTIKARRVGRSSKRLPGNGERVLIEVCDTGVGMDEETRERVFDPFFTTKDHTRGTGLGLATAFATVQRHGGTIQVDSELGRGSRFSILLPIARAQPSPVTKHRMATPMRGLGGRGLSRVLVIDDEPLVLRSTRRQLKSLGYSSGLFADPDEALETLRADPHGFDAAVVDLHLDGTSATELIPKLRAIRPELPILVFSGHWTDEQGAALRQQNVALLQKPCSAETLERALRRLAGSRDDA